MMAWGRLVGWGSRRAEAARALRGAPAYQSGRREPWRRHALNNITQVGSDAAVSSAPHPLRLCPLSPSLDDACVRATSAGIEGEGRAAAGVR